MYPLFPPIFYG